MKRKKRALFGVSLLLIVFLSSGVLADSDQPGIPLLLLNGNSPSPLVTVISAGGRIWMDRNLGASQVATSSDDSLAYGDLYQWGRLADGHQSRTSATTDVLSPSDVPGHGKFILAPTSPWDWRISQASILWQGVNGINNPCPSDFRLPTEAEWVTELGSWSSTNAAGAYASPLKLVVAGYRMYDYGRLSSVGSGGTYWSSTLGSQLDTRLYLLISSADAKMNPNSSAMGFSVRCIKE